MAMRCVALVARSGRPAAARARPLPASACRKIARSSSSGAKGGSETTKSASSGPSIPDATTLFKMSNPELMLDPNKSTSWKIVGGVVLFFSVYLTISAYREGLLSHSPVQEPPTPTEPALDIQRMLPDGRALLKDGSIQTIPKQ